MLKSFPARSRHNALWTPFQRRTWLTDQRRQARVQFNLAALFPAPVLAPLYPDLLVWDWDLPNPCRWNVWQSVDSGASYFLNEDYWCAGDQRQFSPDGGGELHFIVGVDELGREVTHRSNSVRPDDAPGPPTLATDLAGYWKLDEDLGQPRLDSTAAAQHLADDNSDFPSGPGLLGDAAMNDAEYLDCQLSADLAAPFSGPARSVSWWVNPSSLPASNFQIFLCLDGGDQTDYPDYAVQCFAVGYFDFCAQFFGPYVSLLGFIAFDAWNHLVATSDGTTARLYLNGVCVATDVPADSSPAKLWIGNYYDMDRSIVGSLDEVGLWNRCLTDDEIASLYNFGSGLVFEGF
jgi:hypothetical protein